MKIKIYDFKQVNRIPVPPPKEKKLNKKDRKFEGKKGFDDLLNGGYNGLYGEVVTEDQYHIRDLPDIVSINDPAIIHRKGHKRAFNFVPDVILDLGANIGIFSRYARELFPDALIVSVEPSKDNVSVFQQIGKDENTILINKAIGKGAMYHAPNAINGAHEVYLSKNSGFKSFEALNKSDVSSIMLTDLKKYIDGKVLCKLDIEGNETVIFEDAPSMGLLLSFDYVAIELHYFGDSSERVQKIKASTKKALNKFKKTHEVTWEHPFFYANRYE